MLTLKHLPLKSFNENIVYIHSNCIYYDTTHLKTMTKVEVIGGPRKIYAFLQVTDSEKLVLPNELALNDEAFRQINLPEGANVTVTPTSPLPSISSVRRKMLGNTLSENEYKSIMDDITSRRYSNTDIAAFLVASGTFMSPPEVLSMTKALIGKKIIRWKEDIITDSHSLGGVPGNKVDLIVTPIVAAYGLKIAKTASHSLTASAGVADTMSVLCDVDLDETTFAKLVEEGGGAITSYNSIGISEASKIIAAVERNIGITRLEHVIASILAIKAAAGVTHLVLDIPVGPNSRVKTSVEALHVRKIAEYVGDQMSMHVDATITDGSEPIGYGVGPVLEARDVMKVLLGKEDAPTDLREKALFIAGRILEFDPKLRGGQGYKKASELLYSGKALDAMNQIIRGQGKAKQPQIGHITTDIVAEHDGTITAINNQRINKIATLAGSDRYQGAGIDLFKKVGDKVEEGDVLYKIYSVNASDFAFANGAAEGSTGFEIEDEEDEN